MRFLSLVFLASVASLVSARAHVHHRHKRDNSPQVFKRDDCDCYTYVTSWLVDYVPPMSSMELPSTSSTSSSLISKSSTVSYTSTDVEYVYVTVFPTTTAVPKPRVNNSTSSSTDYTSTVVKTIKTTLFYTPTTSTTPSTSTSSTASSTSSTSSTSTTSTTSTMSTMSTSSTSSTSSSSTTSSTTSSTPPPPTSTSLPEISTTTELFEATSTVFSTVTVMITVTPSYSTAYTTTTCSPGVYTFGDVTTTVYVDQTVTVPCSTATLLPTPLPIPTMYPPAVVVVTEPVVTETAYSTVSCSPGVYTFNGAVTTVTEATMLIVSATPAPVIAKRDMLYPHEEFALKLEPTTELPQLESSAPGPWAISYAPYTRDGVCKTGEQIAADISRIATKGFRAVRVYSTDCGALTAIVDAAKSAGVRLIFGASINGETGLSGAQEQIDAMTKLPRETWDYVDMIVIGNEAVFNDFVTAAELANFIVAARAKLREVEFAGPVTTAETPSVLIEFAGTLCLALDAAGVNVHPFFDAGVAAADAGRYVNEQVSLVGAACEYSLPVAVLETGWPSAGAESNGLAVAGVDFQAVAIASIRDATDPNGNVVYFTFEDDEWKLPGVFGVEQRFGVVDAF
ncbi:glycoside hydrolase superfamily [Lipomyces arxii]|uniref:glycoside hydrolase superfamily n=1 Tax=Lipomyces arxii TaxID=56418 RepID=UPI0034CE6C2F